MLVFSFAGAPLGVSQDATRAVNLLYLEHFSRGKGRYGSHLKENVNNPYILIVLTLGRTRSQMEVWDP